MYHRLSQRPHILYLWLSQRPHVMYLCLPYHLYIFGCHSGIMSCTFAYHVVYVSLRITAASRHVPLLTTPPMYLWLSQRPHILYLCLPYHLYIFGNYIGLTSCTFAYHITYLPLVVTAASCPVPLLTMSLIYLWLSQWPHVMCLCLPHHLCIFGCHSGLTFCTFAYHITYISLVVTAASRHVPLLTTSPMYLWLSQRPHILFLCLPCHLYIFGCHSGLTSCAFAYHITYVSLVVTAASRSVPLLTISPIYLWLSQRPHILFLCLPYHLYICGCHSGLTSCTFAYHTTYVSLVVTAASHPVLLLTISPIYLHCDSKWIYHLHTTQGIHIFYQCVPQYIFI